MSHCVWYMLAAASFGGSLAAERRKRTHAADALLFAAYAMLAMAAGVIAGEAWGYAAG